MTPIIQQLRANAKLATHCKRCSGRGVKFSLDTGGDSDGPEACPVCYRARTKLEDMGTTIKLLDAIDVLTEALEEVSDKTISRAEYTRSALHLVASDGLARAKEILK